MEFEQTLGYLLKGWPLEFGYVRMSIWATQSGLGVIFLILFWGRAQGREDGPRDNGNPE